MAPPFLRSQTKRLIWWIIQKNAVPDEKQDSIQQYRTAPDQMKWVFDFL
jgi:hypothetical protein